jgi:hypothetical protein
VRTVYNNMALTHRWSSDPDLKGESAVRAFSQAFGGAFFLSAALLSKALFDVDDEEEEAIRQQLAPFQRNTTIVHFGRDAEGKVMYWDAGALNPFQYIIKPFQALKRIGDISPADAATEALIEILDPYLGPDIAAQAISEAMLNRKFRGGAFGVGAGLGGRVYNPEDDTLSIAESLAKHFGSALMPGTVTQGANVVLGAQGYQNRWGKVYTLEDEALGMAGVRVGRLDPRVSLSFKALDVRTRLNDASTLYNRTLTDPNEVTGDEIRQAFENANTARVEAYTEMLGAIKAARTNGVDPKIIRDILVGDASIARKDVNQLMLGKVPEWKPSDKSLKKKIDTYSRLYSDKAVSQRLRERLKLL